MLQLVMYMFKIWMQNLSRSTTHSTSNIFKPKIKYFQNILHSQTILHFLSTKSPLSKVTQPCEDLSLASCDQTIDPKNLAEGSCGARGIAIQFGFEKATLMFNNNKTNTSYCCTNVAMWSLMQSMMHFMLLNHKSSIKVSMLYEIFLQIMFLQNP